MGDSFSAPECTDDLDGLQQTLLPRGLTRPWLTGDIFIQGFARTYRHPESVGIHACQCGSSLCNHRRMVAPHGTVDYPARDLVDGQCCAEPTSCEAALALRVAPRMKMVGAHKAIETCLRSFTTNSSNSSNSSGGNCSSDAWQPIWQRGLCISPQLYSVVFKQ